MRGFGQGLGAMTGSPGEGGRLKPEGKFGSAAQMARWKHLDTSHWIDKAGTGNSRRTELEDPDQLFLFKVSELEPPTHLISPREFEGIPRLCGPKPRSEGVRERSW